MAARGRQVGCQGVLSVLGLFHGVLVEMVIIVVGGRISIPRQWQVYASLSSSCAADLLHIWTLRSKHATLDEQHCVERILGRDNVRSSDLIKLASILQKISDPKTVYEFFAMDGYQGEYPKKYIDLFRYEAEEARGKHVRSVRQLYRSGIVQTPHECRSFLESIFEGTCPESRNGYVESVQEQVAEIAEWRREQQTKKKRPLETKEESVKKSAPGNP
ncbi:uncharacterized protein TNCT_117681 [Trichonephila clavata]|uniref:Uncharacterized protein n=1 Tax=Trichonephila clavata TaxID=2740835 RepID=A0A8X6KY73_TRICU|nr:uncharacterized protein TNCT_117681 [Trichonephila clavata]